MSATPTPWKVAPIGESVGADGCRIVAIRAPYGREHAVATTNMLDSSETDHNPENIANAALIVRAVNERQPMVDALKTLLSEMTTPAEQWSKGSGVDLARAALRRATEGQ